MIRHEYRLCVTIILMAIGLCAAVSAAGCSRRNHEGAAISKPSEEISSEEGSSSVYGGSGTDPGLTAGGQGAENPGEAVTETGNDGTGQTEGTGSTDTSSTGSSGSKQDFISLSDIRYAGDIGSPYLLDLMFTADGRKKPVMLIVHGGSYISGDKSEMASYQRYYSKDYVTVSINYPLLPDTTFVEQYKAVELAMDFVVKHAEEMEADLEKVVLLGFSAGAQLAVRAGEEIALHESSGRQQDYKVVAIIDIAGPTDQDSLKEIADPELYDFMMSHSELVDGIPGLDMNEEGRKVDCSENITEGMAPVLILHGMDDDRVSPLVSARFYDKLVEKGIECSIRYFDWQPHSIDLKMTIPEIDAFLEKVQ